MKRCVTIFSSAKTLFILLTIFPILDSCKNVQKHDIEYVPFQESKEGYWGMISPNGDVLFKDMYKNEPTVVVNGRFMVRNSYNLWEIYTAKKEPEKIGKEYVQAGLFYEDVAPAVEKNGPIVLIDRDGNIVKKLERIGGKPVEICENFINGLAKIKIGGSWGAIDTNGELRIPPAYYELYLSEYGKNLGILDKYKDETDKRKITYSVLNQKGEVINDISGTKIAAIDDIVTDCRINGPLIKDGFLVCPQDGDPLNRAIMGYDGDWILPPSRTQRSLDAERGGNVIFSLTGRQIGLLNYKGEELIRPKFYFLIFGSDDILIGSKIRKHDWGLFSLDGNNITSEEFDIIFPSIDDQHFFAKSFNEFVVLDKTGKQLKLKTDIYNVSFRSGDQIIESQQIK